MSSLLSQSAPIILCVDDEESILHSLERCFLSTGYKIITALSASQGLSILEKMGGDIDLIIIDQKMPGMMGDEFLRIANERFGRFDSIMLSGFVDLEGLDRAIKYGNLVRFIPKPWNNQELREAVSQILSPREGDKGGES